MAFSPSSSPNTPLQTPPQQPEAKEANNYTTLLVILAGAIAYAFWKPDNARTVVVFLITLGILIFVHEWGHYQFARWAGMKVNRFGIGFPPWIYTVRRNNIDYSLGALPIGGMVDIAGLGSEEEMVATAKGETVTEPTRPATNAPRGKKQFQDANLFWRFMTLFAGPLMNFIFAIVLFMALYSIVGIPNKFSSTNVVEVAQIGMPAAKAGIQAEDAVIAINGRRTTDTKELVKLIRDSKGQPTKVTFLRNGQTIEKTITPVMGEVDKLDGKGKEQGAKIGIAFSERVDSYQRVSLGEALFIGWDQTKEVSGKILALLGRAASRNLSKEEKDGIGGPVKMAQVVGQSSRQSWYRTIELGAIISINLGLMNLLPFPALDGGRILFLGYELVMRRPIDARKESIVHMVGMVMLLSFMLFITARDILPIFSGS